MFFFLQKSLQPFLHKIKYIKTESGLFFILINFKNMFLLIYNIANLYGKSVILLLKTGV